MLGECCTCVFVFTNGGNDLTTITQLLISWPSPTAQLYSSCLPRTADNQMFPFSALDSETSTESKDRDEHVLDSELPERSPSGRTPLNDVVNSETAHLVESSHRVREGQQKQKPRHHTRFDAFVKPEHQPFQTSWSTVCLLYTSPSPRDATLSRMPSSA